MIWNDDTLPEPLHRQLVRANYLDSDDSRQLVESSLHDLDPRSRVLALRAGNRHSWLETPAWRAALKDNDAAVRREAATLLSQRSDVVVTVRELLIERLDDPDDLVVEAAAFALGELREGPAVDRLMEVATLHEDARCRESAIAALGMIGDERSCTVIIAALNDKPPVRRRAIVALANFEGPEVDAALEAAKEDRDWQVRAAVDQLQRSPLADD